MSDKPRINVQIAREQAGFRPSRGTIEQIFSLRLLAENYMGIQDGVLHHIFIDFRKAFDRVWHEGEYCTFMAFNQPKLVNLLQNL